MRERRFSPTISFTRSQLWGPMVSPDLISTSAASAFAARNKKRRRAKYVIPPSVLEVKRCPPVIALSDFMSTSGEYSELIAHLEKDRILLAEYAQRAELVAASV